MPRDPAVEVLRQAASSRESPRPATRMDGPHALPLACRYGARRMLALAVSLAWPFMLPDAALAQVRPDAGRIERDFERDRVPSAPPPKPAAPVFDEGQRPAMAAPDNVSFPVSGFRITRNTVFPEAELLALLKDFVGKELSLADLQRAADAITAHYRERGYFVARAYVPAQEIRDGIVEIMVLEGRLDGISLKPASELRLRPELVEQALREALPSGGVIRETDLERGLLLLNDLPGITVRSVISPGSTLGTSTITAEVSEGPLVTGSIDTDTHGNKYSGYYQLGATLNLNDPTGHGDFFTARIAATSGTSYGRLAYQIPLGDTGLRLAGIYSETRYELCCDFDALEAEGDAQTATLVLQYPFVRGRDGSLYGSLAYDARSYFDETIAGTTDDKKTRLFTLGINGDGRDFLYGGGLNNFWLAATSGRLDLDDWAPYKAADAASARSQGGYGKLSWSLSRLQSLGASTSLYAGLAGQFASKNLDSSEKFVLGGASGLRGYPSGEAAGDEGLLVNMELRHNFLDSLQLTGFVEHGEIRLHKNPWAGWQGANTRISNRYGLSDFGLALNWHQPGRLVVRASAARPMGSNPGRSLDGKDSDGRKSGTHFWLQMVKFL